MHQTPPPSTPLKERILSGLLYIIPHHFISRQLYWLSRVKNKAISQFLIRQYAKAFKVDMAQAAEPDLRSYPSLNAFFTRALADDARPMPESPEAIACPADGILSESAKIEDHSLIQAKGHHYDLHRLLGGYRELSSPFVDGDFATVYLSPRDYHRMHMPCDATLTDMIYVPGRLFSVSLMTTRNIPEIFTRNERVICLFDTAKGRMALVLVGAINVAAIETVWAGLITPPPGKDIHHTHYEKPIVFKRGMEMGRFNMGSTIVMLTEKGAVQWGEAVKPGTPVKVGDELGHWHTH
ncbi:MAG: archaetidylserine decarboxylase [bacterium]